MVKELDQRAASEAATSASIEVVAIRNGDAASIAESLDAMFADSGAAMPPTIRTDASGMALLVRGDAAHIIRIRALAQELDRAAAGSRRMRSVAIDPARADAAEVARLLDRMLERDGEAVEVVSLEELLARYPESAPASGDATNP